MAYQRGLRGVNLRGLGALQIVKDPSSGQQVLIPTTTTEVDVTPSGSQFYDLTSGSPVYLGPGQSGGVADWLVTNSTTVLIGAGVFLGAMLLMRGMR